jgi:hypothetical protein
MLADRKSKNVGFFGKLEAVTATSVRESPEVVITSINLHRSVMGENCLLLEFKLLQKILLEHSSLLYKILVSLAYFSIFGSTYDC